MAPDAAAAPAAAPTVVTAPVVVVGGGLAGLAAALSAAASGAARVLLIDKAGGVGGNSAKASSGVSAVASAVGDQATGAVVEDAVATFRADLLKSGRGRSAAHLADALAAQGGDALKWLEMYVSAWCFLVVVLAGGGSVCLWCCVFVLASFLVLSH